MKKLCFLAIVCFFTLLTATTAVFAAANPINPAAQAQVALPGGPSAEYMKSINIMRDNKYNENEIKSFVYQVFSLFDRHVDFRQISVIFSEDDLEMKVPEAKIASQDDLAIWYANVGARIQSNTHAIETLTVTIPKKNDYNVDLTVLWQAVGKDGKFIAQRFHQQWKLVDGGGYWPRIVKYISEPVQ